MYTASPGSNVNESRGRFNLTELLNEQIDRNESLNIEIAELNALQKKLLNLLQSKDKQIDQLKQKKSPASFQKRVPKVAELDATLSRVFTILKYKEIMALNMGYDSLRNCLLKHKAIKLKLEIWMIRVNDIIRARKKMAFTIIHEKTLTRKQKEIQQIRMFFNIIKSLEKSLLLGALSSLRFNTVRKNSFLKLYDMKKSGCEITQNIFQSIQRRRLLSSWSSLVKHNLNTKCFMIRELQMQTVSFFQKKLAASKIFISVMKKIHGRAEKHKRRLAFKIWDGVTRRHNMHFAQESTNKNNKEEINIMKRLVFKKMGADKLFSMLANKLKVCLMFGFFRVKEIHSIISLKQESYRGARLHLALEKVLERNKLNLFMILSAKNFFLASKIRELKQDKSKSAISSFFTKSLEKLVASRKKYVNQILKYNSKIYKNISKANNIMKGLFRNKRSSLLSWGLVALQLHSPRIAFRSLKIFIEGNVSEIIKSNKIKSYKKTFKDNHKRKLTKTYVNPRLYKILKKKIGVWKKNFARQLKMQDAGIKHYMENLTGVVKIMEKGIADKDFELEERKRTINQILSDNLNLEKTIEGLNLKNSIITSSFDKTSKQADDLTSVIGKTY
jgi:hypothetical protein